MGSGSWSANVFNSYAKTSYTGKTTDDIFSSKGLNPELDPKNVIRESRDSVDNPNSTPVILALDVTGSMSSVLDLIVREGMNDLCKAIFEKKPITDPHIMCMGIGDVEIGDRAPLQVSQFEADLRILKDLEKIWLEKGGGGNDHESYLLPLYFAANNTKIDSFEKRQKKGFLFTIGDEEPQERLLNTEIDGLLGSKPQSASFSAAQVLSMATKQWEVYHVIIEQGSHAGSQLDKVQGLWRRLLGQRVLSLPDYKLLPEVIVSTMQHIKGLEKDKILNSWEPSKVKVLETAMRFLP